MKKLLALLLLAATPLFANPFLVCPAVTAGVSNSPVTYTVSGLPNSPIVSNAATITTGTVQLDLDLGASGQAVPYGTYTVSATATNPNGTSSSSGNTTLNVPAINTPTSSSVTSTAAALNSNLTQDGGTQATGEGFYWGTTASYGNTATVAGGPWTSGAFSANLTSLTPSTTYHYQAFATNGNCGAYSSDQTFTTSAATNQALAFSGTGQHLDVSNAIISTLPISFACWFKPASLAANGVMMSISDTSTQYHYLDLYCNTSGKLVGVISNSSGIDNVATSTASMSTGTWYQCSVVFTGTSVTVYLNGTANTSSASVAVPTGINISSIGCLYDSGTSTPQALVNGSVAYPTIWSSALTSTDETNLYNSGSGAIPNTIESGTVVSYSPFQGSSPWADGVSTNTWTTTGSPTTGTAPF